MCIYDCAADYYSNHRPRLRPSELFQSCIGEQRKHEISRVTSCAYSFSSARMSTIYIYIRCHFNVNIEIILLNQKSTK